MASYDFLDVQANHTIAASFEAIPPALTFTKTVTPDFLPEPGGPFTFTLTITNIGVEPFTITTLTDTNLPGPLPPEVAALVGQSAPVGGSVSASYPITHTDPNGPFYAQGFYDNTASVLVTGNNGATVTSQADAYVWVDDLLPTVTLENWSTSPPCPKAAAHSTSP